MHHPRARGGAGLRLLAAVFATILLFPALNIMLAPFAYLQVRRGGGGGGEGLAPARLTLAMRDGPAACGWHEGSCGMLHHRGRLARGRQPKCALQRRFL
jgi:hypothetical protein